MPVKIETETRRYGSKSIPPEQRICKICDLSSVEDEFHCLIICPEFSNLRNCLFKDLKVVDSCRTFFENIV